ncbi:MAG: 30S ribosomal protein S20 [Desulforegulaceae bacterium]|nr:30S ribosomal protein S20 [Desulforegulaceae bacterium]
MANHKSALKRVKQDEKRNLRNKAVKTKVKTITKKTIAAAQAKEDTVKNFLSQATSIITKAAQKGSIHKNTASRKISRLTKFVEKTINS